MCGGQGLLNLQSIAVLKFGQSEHELRALKDTVTARNVLLIVIIAIIILKN